MADKIKEEVVQVTEAVVEAAPEVVKNKDFTEAAFALGGFAAGVIGMIAVTKGLEFGKKKLAERKAKKAKKAEAKAAAPEKTETTEEK